MIFCSDIQGASIKSLPVDLIHPSIRTMKTFVAVVAALSLLQCIQAFAPVLSKSASIIHSRPLFSTTQEEKETEETKKPSVPEQTAGADAIDVDNSVTASATPDPDASGLPWWWELVWKLDIMRKGEEGEDVIFGDSANVLRTNIEQIYGGYPSLDGCPLAEGDITDIADGTMFIGLQRYQAKYNSPYKLCFGPKSFLVVSDPTQAKHILRDANTNYDKGILSEILEPIMGKGLIPADPATWSVRRRAIVPAFHKAWLEHMVGLFGYCNSPLIDNLNTVAATSGKVEMEERFCSVALDIIGKAVFNYEFGSVTSESPVIQAVYSALLESKFVT